MLGRLLLAAVFAVAVVGPAGAFHCPADIAAINNALSKANLSAEDEATVKTLRDEGQALHDAGKHKESVGKLAEAMRIILNSL
jgi:hypothetical protein